jgi:hypothetical protein
LITGPNVCPASCDTLITDSFVCGYRLLTLRHFKMFLLHTTGFSTWGV